MSWDPALYLKYGAERTRPAADLLTRVDVEDPRQVVDLGCGPGTSTALLTSRWPSAHVTAVDGDAGMLDRARRSGPRCHYVQADIASWMPDERPEVIFSNAALHWLDDHETLFPRLMRLLPVDGVLAAQMPRNFEAPSHTLMRDVARSGAWADTLVPLLRNKPVADPETYYRWLAPLSSTLEIWETTYLVRLSGADPVLSWVRGTTLRPLLDALDMRTAATFEAAYAHRLREAYPREANGVTLFPFRRLFIVATRAARGDDLARS